MRCMPIRHLILMLVIAFALFGCQRERPSVRVNTTGPAAAKTIRIAVIPKSTSHAFWQTVKAGAEAAGKEAGAEILWTGPSKETDITAQIDILQNQVSGKVDGIV